MPRIIERLFLNTTNKELTPVQVEYKGFEPEEALIVVDGEKLGKALADVGYPRSVASKPLLISNRYSRASGTVILFSNQVALNEYQVRYAAKEWYSYVLDSLGEATTPELVEQSFVKRVINSEAFLYLYPLAWPVHFLKNRTKMINVDRSRTDAYLRKARERNLKPSQPTEIQIQHAKKAMTRLLRMSLSKLCASIIVHEYEHKHKETRKFIMQIVANTCSVLAGTGIALAYKKIFGHPAPLGPLYPMVTGLVGLTASSAVVEQMSENAASEHFEAVMGCIHINPDVFEKIILGNNEESELK